MEFRRIFKEMLKISKLGPLLEVAQLASKLAEEAKRLIMGVEEPVEAWRLLVERYLYRHMAILLAMHNLQSVRIPQGPAHDKVEALVLKVRTKKMCLRAAGAKHQLFADCLTMGKLVGKLTKNTQGRWFHYRAGDLSLPEKVSFEA